MLSSTHNPAVCGKVNPVCGLLCIDPALDYRIYPNWVIFNVAVLTVFQHAKHVFTPPIICLDVKDHIFYTLVRLSSKIFLNYQFY